MKPYEKLAEFYKKDWGNESIKYIELINGIIKTFDRINGRFYQMLFFYLILIFQNII